MQLGHMVLNTQCYQGALSRQAVKVNSQIIYTRLVNRSEVITQAEAPSRQSHSLSLTYQQLTLSRRYAKKRRLTSFNKRECTRRKGGEGTEGKKV